MGIMGKIRTGCFVLTGILLFFAAVFFIGFRHIFQPKVTMFTVFNETVQGLTVGSPVKFGGVEYGRVIDIDFNLTRNCVYVTFEVYPDQIFSDDDNVRDRQLPMLDPQSEMRGLVEGGLYCHLALLGITGLVYIETDYDKSTYDTLDSDYHYYIPDGAIYVPAMRSVQSDIIATARDLVPKMDEAFGRLNELDIAKINNLIEKMHTLSEGAAQIDFTAGNRVFEEFSKSAVHLQELLVRFDSVSDTERFNTILDNTAVASTKLNILLKELDLPGLADKLEMMAMSIAEASETLRYGREDVTQLLPKLSEAVNIANDVLRKISENPAILIRGEKGTSPLKSNP